MMSKTATTTNFKSMSFSLRLGGWEFTPGLIPTLAVILLLPLLCSLGVWQLHRAVAKQQLLDQFAQRSQQKPQPLANDELIYTPVQVSGRFDIAHPLLLDNRIVNNAAGYDVLVPFIPTAEGDSTLQVANQRIVLVNLGWIPRSACYAQAAESQQLTCPVVDSVLRTQQQPATITGLAQPPEHNLVLAHPAVPLNWPLVVEDVQLDALSKTLNRPLYPYILLFTGNGGLQPHWQLVTSVTPARHRGYAVQWFALALTLLFLYGKLNLRRIKQS